MVEIDSATDEQHERLGKGYPYTLRPELHKALKARGVDYWVAQGLTFWNCPDGRECVAYGYQSNGKPRLAVKIAGITDPEQAIEVTLGRGTCHDLGGTGANGEQVFNCSECGCVLSLYDRDGSNNLCTSFIFDYPRHCPECGRKVVDE